MNGKRFPSKLLLLATFLHCSCDERSTPSEDLNADAELDYEYIAPTDFDDGSHVIAPFFTLSPQNISLAIERETGEASVAVTLNYEGEEALQFTIESDVNWISYPRAVELSGLAPSAELRLVFRNLLMEPGIYEDVMRVRALSNPPLEQAIYVRLELLGSTP
ncbi:MAG: hypothetical protein RBU37_02700 [Myxococcota bacterium]|jgi:hypothetical protein|nr:hypothetical protein [Myxococcota bacterium]